MLFNEFKDRVLRIIQKAGINCRVFFEEEDPSDGRFQASIPSEGMVIIGSTGCNKVEVRWGKGAYGYLHKSITKI